MNKFARISTAVSDRARNLAIAATVGVLASPVFAQTTDPFDTAMTTITGKVEGYAAALVGLAAVAVVFMVGLKYVKKIPRAS